MAALSGTKATKSRKSEKTVPGNQPHVRHSVRRHTTASHPVDSNKRTPAREEQPSRRTTKQDRMLTLLSRPEGASVEELMQVTDWQIHSVRGFLAGTVKKKLGFTLASSISEGGVRRYRIESRRGR